jgi:diketogulonate reductase-like aldo/keto reductase
VLTRQLGVDFVDMCEMRVPTPFNHHWLILRPRAQPFRASSLALPLVHSWRWAQYTGELSLVENWKVMEQLRAEGLCKSIGVSNYREEDLLAIKDAWSVPPAVNQVRPRTPA